MEYNAYIVTQTLNSGHMTIDLLYMFDDKSANLYVEFPFGGVIDKNSVKITVFNEDEYNDYTLHMVRKTTITLLVSLNERINMGDYCYERFEEIISILLRSNPYDCILPSSELRLFRAEIKYGKDSDEYRSAMYDYRQDFHDLLHL